MFAAEGSRREVRMKIARARQIAKRSITLSAGIGIVLSVLSQIVLPWLIPIFCSSAEVVQLASRWVEDTLVPDPRKKIKGKA